MPSGGLAINDGRQGDFQIAVPAGATAQTAAVAQVAADPYQCLTVPFASDPTGASGYYLPPRLRPRSRCPLVWWKAEFDPARRSAPTMRRSSTPPCRSRRPMGLCVSLGGTSPSNFWGTLSPIALLADNECLRGATYGTSYVRNYGHTDVLQVGLKHEHQPLQQRAGAGPLSTRRGDGRLHAHIPPSRRPTSSPACASRARTTASSGTSTSRIAPTARRSTPRPSTSPTTPSTGSTATFSRHRTPYTLYPALLRPPDRTSRFEPGQWLASLASAGRMPRSATSSSRPADG